jgi:hypothetical protein
VDHELTADSDPEESASTFDKSAHSFQRQLEDLLAKNGWRRRNRTLRPEIRRVLVRALCYTEELRALHEASDSTRHQIEPSSLCDLFDDRLNDMDIVTGWALADRLQREVLRIANDPTLHALLAAETIKDRPRPSVSAVPWDSMYPIDSLEEFLNALHGPEVPKDQRAHAKACLESLYLRRSEVANRDRAEQQTRSAYLARWTAILCPLVILLGLSVNQAMASVWHTWVVLVGAVAGALGSTLKGLLHVRQLSRLAELRSFRALLLTQPVIGAGAALIVLLLLESHVVVLPGTTSTSATGWAAILPRCHTTDHTIRGSSSPRWGVRGSSNQSLTISNLVVDMIDTLRRLDKLWLSSSGLGRVARSGSLLLTLGASAWFGACRPIGAGPWVALLALGLGGYDVMEVGRVGAIDLLEDENRPIATYIVTQVQDGSNPTTSRYR